MSSLYITLGNPDWEDVLLYECEHSHHILLQKPKGDADGLMIKAEAILKAKQFERHAGQNKAGNFVSYQKIALD